LFSVSLVVGGDTDGCVVGGGGGGFVVGLSFTNLSEFLE